MPEAVRIEVGQPSRRAGFLEYPANRISIAPAFPAEAGGAKSSVRPKCDSCCWEQRVIRTPEQLGSQILYQRTTISRSSSPTGKNVLVNVFANFVFTSRASWRILLASMFTCLSFIDAIARSRAPLTNVKAMRAWSRRSIAGSSGHALNE